ncbi:Predicted ATPase (AAA+ superfamily) [[Eubacterium] siraeum V10Sc8a]|uniref:Predicted ATPase (AAA+ superfamily) n=1 Tax=[Eubacterium] siraeum V10Sc8a TaxID=717961 RepID=D4MNQ8_9FIRM|nr:Predicted ATPase (AAA+ superfamily) [[Eubacterium] siraeum V10Sc8a]
MEIKRDYYLNKLITKKHNGLIKVITGIRRCGKSYLLFTLFKNHLTKSGVADDHIIEIPFDSFENKKYRDPEILYPYVKEQIADDGMYYILLDEVQLLDEFESVLNGFMRMKNVDVYVTGSNARFLSKDIITEFRGRGDELHIQPLSFAEFMSVYDGNKYDGWNEYVLYGGLPPVVLLRTAEQKIELLKSLFQETYINDIISRHSVKHRDEFEELINILASAIGSLTNPKKLTDTFKSKKNKVISSNTIKSYLDYLCDAYVVSRATRYDIKGKKYIDTPQKYYFSDVGIRNACINFRQLEENHTMENIIYNELIARNFNVDVGIITATGKDNDGKSVRKQLEVDFVCNKGSKRYYIQSAFSIPDREKMEQESNSLLRIDDSFKKIIVVKDLPAPTYTDNGILVISVYDFLLNSNSLDM